jgi:hypothetical protein
MGNKDYTPEDIFLLIKRRLVMNGMGIKLIENYGLRKQRDALEKLQSELGRIRTKLDAMLDAAEESLAEAQ